MPNETRPLRRFSDKVLAAFHQACDQGDAEAAALLLKVLELNLTKQGGREKIENRNDVQAIEQAFERLDTLQQA